MNQQSKYGQLGLYRSEYEHDACGVGMVANLSGEANHDIVEKGMTILKRLMHRGATGNDPETGDGAGLLMRIPHGFFKKVLKDVFNAETQRRKERRDDILFGIAMIFGGDGEEGKIEEIVKSEGCEGHPLRGQPSAGGYALKTTKTSSAVFISFAARSRKRRRTHTSAPALRAQSSTRGSCSRRR